MSRSPHDALFKYAFSQPEHAVGELRSVLPASLVEQIDFATLTHVPGSFVDEALADAHTDLLFSPNIAERPALLYFLLEHQSTVDRLMPFRVLRYMVRIWDTWLAEHPDATSLPAIVPIVLHHSERGWTAPVAIEQLLELPNGLLAEMGPHVPRFTFVLDDLTTESDEALHTRAMTALGRSVLFFLRDGRKPGEIARKLEHWADAFVEVLRSPNGLAAFSALVRYIFAVTDITPKDLQRTVSAALGGEASNAMKTTAERLHEEGRREGRQEGRLDGQREMLLRLLKLRFGEPTPEVDERVRSAAPEQIEAWSDQILTAKTLAEVFGNA